MNTYFIYYESLGQRGHRCVEQPATLSPEEAFNAIYAEIQEVNTATVIVLQFNKVG